jgi:hypothetical protein
MTLSMAKVIERRWWMKETLVGSICKMILSGRTDLHRPLSFTLPTTNGLAWDRTMASAVRGS